MANTRLFLLRHGETQANLEQRYQGQGDSHLSELGIEESADLSGSLAKEDFSAIYSSTLSRSYETAKIVAKPHKLEVTKIETLMERNYGIWEGLTFEEIKKRFSDLYGSWLIEPGKTLIPNAESLEALQKRGVSEIEALIEKHKGKTICVAGHGGMNRAVLFHYMHIDLNNFWRIRQDNCCVNIIEFGHVPVITLLNSTAFLGDKKIKAAGVY
jgi:broad specificity phosphatase PhoE